MIQDSLINLSYYVPRNKTPRDLNFALNTIYEKTGQKGNAGGRSLINP